MDIKSSAYKKAMHIKTVHTKSSVHKNMKIQFPAKGDKSITLRKTMHEWRN